MILDVEDKMGALLFDTVQKMRRLKSGYDILGILILAGVYLGEYLKILAGKELAGMTERQKHLFREYGVTGAKSVYVNGSYRVENRTFQAGSREDFRKSYVAVVTLCADWADK